MKILLAPCDKFRKTEIENIDPNQLLPKKYYPHIIEFSEFIKMFNNGDLSLDRTYIAEINENQL
jgi:hypothetical protein